MLDFKTDITLVVDLDKERGIQPKEGRTPNQHRVVIRKTNAVNLHALTAYLQGQTTFDNTILEAISEMITQVMVNQR